MGMLREKTWCSRREAPRVKGRKNVSTQVEEQTRLVYIIFICEKAFVYVGFDNFADKNGVVTSFELTVQFAF